MAHPFRHLISLLGGLLAAFASVRAAETAPLPPVWFTVFAARPIAGVAFRPQPDVLQPVTFYPTARSPHYEYSGPMPLVFVDSATGAAIARVGIPAEIRTALLLFSAMPASAEASALRFQVAVLDDSARQQGPGTLAIVNFSGLELAGTIAGKPVTITDGLTPAWTTGRSAEVRLHALHQGRRRQAFSQNVTLSARQRALLILFPPFYRGSSEVQSRILIDTPPAEMPPPQR